MGLGLQVPFFSQAVTGRNNVPIGGNLDLRPPSGMAGVALMGGYCTTQHIQVVVYHYDGVNSDVVDGYNAGFGRTVATTLVIDNTRYARFYNNGLGALNISYVGVWHLV